MLRIAHVNLSVDDVEAASRFYGEVLRLEPAPRPTEAGRRGLWYRLGERLELHLSVELGADRFDQCQSKAIRERSPSISIESSDDPAPKASQRQQTQPRVPLGSRPTTH